MDRHSAAMRRTWCGISQIGIPLDVVIGDEPAEADIELGGAGRRAAREVGRSFEKRLGAGGAGGGRSPEKYELRDMFS